jgi:hypothetical protein
MAAALFATTVLDDLSHITTAEAHGGAGGNAGLLVAGGAGANGGAGGRASSAATSGGSRGNADVTVTASAYGGDGGAGEGAGHTGGFGGTATAVAVGRSVGSGTVTVNAIQIGGKGGDGIAGADGGAGAASTMHNAVAGSTSDGTLHLNQHAEGGAGGASSSGRPGFGGAATSTLFFDDTLGLSHSASISSTVYAEGGDGGGDATASQTILGAGSLHVVSTAIGGNGIAGQDGGTATASAHGETSGGDTVSVTAIQQGGGGATGAASSMNDAVSGMTDGGALFLSEAAFGGGGDSGVITGVWTGTSGGNGADANAILHFDDTLNKTQSTSVTGSVAAYGGGGGDSFFAGAGNGAGAHASVNMTGSHDVSAHATAVGGDSGTEFDNFGDYSRIVHSGGAGDATATAVADSTNTADSNVNATASAHGGIQESSPGHAMATATGTGHTGLVHADASTEIDAITSPDDPLSSGPPVFAVSATADGGVAGQSTALAEADIHDPAPAHVTGQQAVAIVVAAPTSEAADLTAFPEVQSHVPGQYASGELGVAASTGGSAGAYTQSSSFDLVFNGFSGPHDHLVFGFYDATATGGASGPVSLDIVLDKNTTLLHQTFTDTAAAASYLNDHVFSVGSPDVFDSPGFDVSATLSVAINPGQHAGLYVDVVV